METSDNSAVFSAMGAELVARGIVSQAELDAGMAAEATEAAAGDLPPSDGPTLTPPPDDGTAAPEQASAPNPLDGFDLDPVFAPPADPNAYRFQTLAPLPIEDAKHVNALFHAAKIPQPIAAQIYADVERLDKQFAGMDKSPKLDAEWQLASQQCDLQLRQGWGERYEEMTGHFRRFVADVAKAQPKIIPLLTDSPASNSAVLIRQLAEHAARIYASPRKQ
ncbi:MAG: hypothetical protein NT042_08435 [Sulfuritalea sp.]|nr:hypothetical protein [Sulfuritalea sp.]